MAFPMGSSTSTSAARAWISRALRSTEASSPTTVVRRALFCSAPTVTWLLNRAAAASAEASRCCSTATSLDIVVLLYLSLLSV